MEDLKIKDISNSPAFMILDDLLNQTKMSSEEVEAFKAKYARLHQVVVSTFQSERQLLSSAKELRSSVEAEKKKYEAKQGDKQRVSEEIKELDKESRRVNEELQKILEQNGQLEQDIGDLENQKSEKQQELEEKMAKNLAQLEPVLKELSAKIEEMKAAIEQNQEALNKENSSVADYASKVDGVSKELVNLEKEKLRKRELYNQASTDPEKLQAVIAQVESAHRELQAEASSADEEAVRLRAEYKQIQDKVQDTRAANRGAEAKVETIRGKTAQTLTELEDLRRDRELENLKKEECMEKVEGINSEIESLHTILQNELMVASKHQKDYEGAKKKFERLKRKKETILSTLDPLAHAAEKAAKQLSELQQQYQLQRTMLVEMKRDEELFISQYLQQERLEDESTHMLIGVQSDRKDYENKIAELDKQERALMQLTSKLSSQRELMAREVSKASSQYREIKEDLKVKNLILMDLDKQSIETVARLKACSQKYERMKNQRNKLANLTQSYSQALAEMREKIKILLNEVEILRNETSARDRALAEEARLHHQAQNARDALRAEYNKYVMQLKTKAAEHNQQLAEIAKLNSIVNSAERQMIQLRQDYQQSVDNRNVTGIHLIDRNDELCILYEKAHIQEAMLRKGDEELKKREEEVKALTLDIADIQRKIEIARKRIPSLSVYAATTRTLEELQKQLQAERAATAELGRQLETPSTPQTETTGRMLDLKSDGPLADSRSRKLKGLDPEPEQLAAKTEMLEERLNEKKEQLLEKELVLDEVSSLSEKLRTQAAEKRSHMLDVAKKLSEYQSRIRSFTRKMIATVSELSMYQASALKLEAQKADMEAGLKQARDRLATGQPPTDDAEHEWYRMERTRIMRQEQALERMQQQQAIVEGRAGVPGLVRTSAEPRPNAYIPDDFGIPKPYGNLAPYKPTVLGATARHIRNPIPPPIKL